MCENACPYELLLLTDASFAPLPTECVPCRYRLSFATSEKLQMSALIGAFTVARTGLVAAAK